jgi:hypothetical protein
MQLVTAISDGVLTTIMMKQYFGDANWLNELVSDVLQPRSVSENQGLRSDSCGVCFGFGL